jgi:DNA polymerase III epsilon subunit family exonuclease
MVDLRIISMKRSATKNSGSPMWFCETLEGEKVNIFSHQDPLKNTFRHFEDYHPEMIGMSLGDVLSWRTHPICIRAWKKGQYWEITGADKRPPGAAPDIFDPSVIALYRQAAIDWARSIRATIFLDPKLTVYLDFETTGLDEEDEATSVGMVDITGDVLLDQLIQPIDPDRLLRIGSSGKSAYEVTGIHPDMLRGMPHFEDLHSVISGHLKGHLVLAYNAPFDVGVLKRECIRWKKPLIQPLAFIDVLDYACAVYSEYDEQKLHFKRLTLSEACKRAGVQILEAHRAVNDAQALQQLVSQMAQE